ncbi:MAG TPA: diacylglycerol kinase family protein, partial [Solirubrobacteraceae bacterium]|nr:diacylglycerol kinase family protein [Solirubrobacteraceae bacterium]
MAAPVRLVVNPSAGGGRAGKLAPAVLEALRGHGLEVSRADTRDLGHARELGAAAASAGETVVALSGDGLIGVLADTLRAIPGAVLGVLPGGRGNDLARVLGIPADAVEACAVIAGGVVRPLDLGVVTAGEQMSEQAFVGIASAGFDSDANRIANEAPAWLGGGVYAYGALRALLSWRPAHFSIELDPPSPADPHGAPGERHSFTGYSVALANSRAYGGGMQLAPEAMLDDGLLDIVLSERASKLTFLRSLPKVFAGTHVELDSVRVFRAAEVTVSSDRPFTMYADGDPIGELPLRVRAQRAAVQVLVPDLAGSAFSPPGGRSAVGGSSAPGG